MVCINKPFKVVRAGQLEEVGFLPRVGELDDILSGDTISLGQRREKMAYGTTGDTYIHKKSYRIWNREVVSSQQQCPSCLITLNTRQKHSSEVLEFQVSQNQTSYALLPL